MGDRIPGIPDCDEIARVRFEQSASLQREFGEAETFLAWCRAARSSKIRVPLLLKTTLVVPGTDDLARGEYRRSADLQAEFGDESVFLAYCRAARNGGRAPRAKA